MAKTVAASLIHTCIDCANSLIHGSTNIKKSHVQTSVARVVLPNLSQQPATALLSELHWLCVNSTITFKLAVSYKLLTTIQPAYLCMLLYHYTPTRTLWSTNQFFLVVPWFSTKFGKRSFSYLAPTVWNGLPLNNRLNITHFRQVQGTSFGLQGGYAINHQGSGPGRHGSRGVCLPWLSYPLINRKHLWHQPPKCHHWCCHAELRKSDLEVTARHLNEVEAVQHMYLTNIPVWFGLLGNI